MNTTYQTLVEYLADDVERAKKLLALTAEEACEKINADGYTFTIEELTEVAEDIANMISQESDELSEDKLDAVAGGGKLKVLWWLVKNMPKALYIAWTTEPGKIRQK